MDFDTLSTIVGGVAVASGGFFGGRMTGRYNSHQIAAQTIDMLKTQVDSLTRDKENRDLEILDLLSRVSVLEGLVTQRAEVAQVQETVDRIADKVGA
jgi:hypothetical protein